MIALASSLTHAATFCVETRIFEGDNPDAAAEHRIVFDNGLVYDLPQINTATVTCYDPAQKRVILLDRERQIQTTISTDHLVKLAAQVRAAATPDQRIKFGIDAEVETSDNVNGYTIRFGEMEYHTTTQSPSDPTIAIDYGRFAILASQLNMLRRLGPPPFGRMTLNTYLANQRALPLETTLTVRHGDSSQQYRSTHRLRTELTDDDTQAIQQVRGMMTVYREVEPRAF